MAGKTPRLGQFRPRCLRGRCPPTRQLRTRPESLHLSQCPQLQFPERAILAVGSARVPLAVDDIVPMPRQIGVVSGHLEIQPRVTCGDEIVIDVPVGTAHMTSRTHPRADSKVGCVLETQPPALNSLPVGPIATDVAGNPQTGRTMTRFARNAVGRQVPVMFGRTIRSRWQGVAVETLGRLVSRTRIPKSRDHPPRSVTQQYAIGSRMTVSLDPVAVGTRPTWTCSITTMAIGRRTRIGPNVARRCGRNGQPTTHAN